MGRRRCACGPSAAKVTPPPTQTRSSPPPLCRVNNSSIHIEHTKSFASIFTSWYENAYLVQQYRPSPKKVRLLFNMAQSRYSTFFCLPKPTVLYYTRHAVSCQVSGVYFGPESKSFFTFHIIIACKNRLGHVARGKLDSSNGYLPAPQYNTEGVS